MNQLDLHCRVHLNHHYWELLQWTVGLARFLLRGSMQLKWRKGRKEASATTVMINGHLGISVAGLIVFVGRSGSILRV